MHSEVSISLGATNGVSLDERPRRFDYISTSNASFDLTKVMVRYLVFEIVIRLFLLMVFLYSETMEPFERIIQSEEWWLYKNPVAEVQRFPTTRLYAMTVFAPLVTIILFSGVLWRRKNDFVPALLAATLAFVLNGIITNFVKVAVGRPRPDFFFRCFPNGEPPTGQPSALQLTCTGDRHRIIEGRKSFPSGHSSMSFMSLGFCAVYMCGKLCVFTAHGRGSTWRLLCALLPLVAALLMAISRTCDYMHHWQDVTVGSLLGLGVTYTCYRQYYPALGDRRCFLPHSDHSSPAESGAIPDSAPSMRGMAPSAGQPGGATVKSL